MLNNMYTKLIKKYQIVLKLPYTLLLDYLLNK